MDTATYLPVWVGLESRDGFVGVIGDDVGVAEDEAGSSDESDYLLAAVVAHLE